MGDEQGYIGVIQVVEPKYPTTVQGGKSQSQSQSQSYEWTSRVNNEDKQSGSYERISKKEKVSRYQPYKEWNSGRVGVKDEVVRTSKVKVGDQNGFTEYYSEERVRNVTYNNKGKAYFNERALKDY